jgi:hypothetical protein
MDELEVPSQLATQASNLTLRHCEPLPYRYSPHGKVPLSLRLCDLATPLLAGTLPAYLCAATAFAVVLRLKGFDAKECRALTVSGGFWCPGAPCM